MVPCSITLTVWMTVMAAVCLGALSAAEHRGIATSSRLPVPGATVRATQGDYTVLSTTDERGSYCFLPLTDGIWRIEIEMAGFADVERDVMISESAPGAEWDLKLAGKGYAEPHPAKRAADTVLSAAAPEPGGSQGLKARPAAGVDDTVLTAGGKARRIRPRKYNGSAGVSLDNSAWDARANYSGELQHTSDGSGAGHVYMPSKRSRADYTEVCILAHPDYFASLDLNARCSGRARAAFLT